MIMEILIIIIINSFKSKNKRTPEALNEIKQSKILKQKVMTPHPYLPTLLPGFPVLNLLKNCYKARHDVGYRNVSKKCVKYLSATRLEPSVP